MCAPLAPVEGGCGDPAPQPARTSWGHRVMVRWAAAAPMPRPRPVSDVILVGPMPSLPNPWQLRPKVLQGRPARLWKSLCLECPCPAAFSTGFNDGFFARFALG